MPLEQALKSSLRDRVSTANKSNVDDVADEVNAALSTLDPDEEDHAGLQGWLEDLSVVRTEGCRGSSEARRAPLARPGQRPRPRARGVWSSRWRRRVSARAFMGRRSGKASTLRWIRPSRPSRASTQRS